MEKHEQGDEPYSQGIFIDVFPYDDVSENPKPYLRNKWISKKILRLLSHKYSKVTMGHYAGLYKCISHSVSKSFLESFLQNMHQKNKKEDGSFLGYGYDSTKKGYFTKLDIYPLKRINFEQTYFNAPNHSEKVLQTIYGDYLTLPLEERRKLNHCKQLILDISA